jgi:dTDP-4-amino-4,6-dideoxygalactose transaminase
MMIPHSRPTLSEEEIQAATAVLRSGQIAQGPCVAAFEDEMARWLGLRGAVAVSSGTAALHLSLLALGISAGDEVIFPSYVCAALYHAVVAAGARPVLAEIDEGSLNLDPDDVKRRLTKKTRAVIVVHSFGLPADPGPFLSLGPPVIEDCAQAAGAELNGQPVGSSGQLSIFSFYATKMFTTGEGGMVATDDPTLLDRLRDLREYDERDDLKPRMNAKLTDLASAIGLVQLKKLPAFIARRRAIAGIYRQTLAGAPVDLPPDARTSGHIYHRFIVRLKREPVDRVLAALEKEEIHCRRPVYQPLHRLMGVTGFSTSDRVWQHALSLPCYPSLTDQEAQCVAATLRGSL